MFPSRLTASAEAARAAADARGLTTGRFRHDLVSATMTIVRGVDIEMFWWLVNEVRDRAGAVGARDDEALAECIVDVLAARLTARELFEFDALATDLAHQADTSAMVAAMFLLEGYVSDDTFMDFRDGLILLGRSTFEAAIANPDSLAEHLVAAGSTSTPAHGLDLRTEISFESISSCVADAWLRVTGEEDEDEFWEAAHEFENAVSHVQQPSANESWDVRDANVIRQRLPRLAERFAHRLEPKPSTLRYPDPVAPPTRDRPLVSDFQDGVARGRETARES